MTETKDHYPSRGDKETIIDRVDPVIFDGAARGEHSLDEGELEAYEKNGFILFPGLFSKEEVRIFLDELEGLKHSEELKAREEFIAEPETDELRSIFSPNRFSPVFERLSREPRILDKVTQILGGGVYIHHSRINIKNGFSGKSFPWHSDFETWHAEDGLPRIRCLTGWVMLTENNEFNGPLYLITGSHKKFVGCAGRTPKDHFKESLKKQVYGSPSTRAIERLADDGGIVGVYGQPGTLVLHEGNIMHGSPDNISPMARTNIFFVYNSVNNVPAARPFGSESFRPEFLSNRDHTPLEAVEFEEA